MINQILDSENNIIYTGPDADKVFNVLQKDPRDVTEEDEVRYGELLYSLSWIGKLKLQKNIFIKFRGIDDFNRPVFKDSNGVYFGSTSILFSSKTDSKVIIDTFKQDDSTIVFFGYKFNCEPHGGRADFWKFNFIEN